MTISAHFVPGTGTVWSYHTAAGTSRAFETRAQAEAAYRATLRANLA